MKKMHSQGQHFHDLGADREKAHMGFGMVEALVAGFLLIAAVTQAISLFFASINATDRARLRDGLNSAISADLEQVRHKVASWALNANNDSGQLSYEPGIADCNNASLGVALLADLSTELPRSSVLDLSKAPDRLGAITVNRSVSVVTGNNNLIQVSYSTAADSPIKVESSSTLSIPAQGWCP